MCLMNDDRCLRTKTNTPPDVLPCSDSFVDLKEKRHNHRTSHTAVLNPRTFQTRRKYRKNVKNIPLLSSPVSANNPHSSTNTL